uniref:winged helix-turn-helix domain-containing protein n=1 Tax=Hafnia alvei TaxID=569 RepID=UPI00242C236A|nr:winged helix-turn-helix domain-containing protein [Hafnia alvei]
MIYIINKKVVFNTDDHSIKKLEDNDNPKFLSTAGARLLELFITHNHQCLVRDTILEMVWDRHGLHSSNNNLNNSISIVRRLLIEFDINNVIITHPKIGFTAAFESIEIQSMKFSIFNAFENCRMWLYLNLVLSFLCMILFYLYAIVAKNSELDKTEDNYTSIESLGTCKVHFKFDKSDNRSIYTYCKKNSNDNIYIYNPIESNLDIIKKFEITCKNNTGALCISDSLMDYTN